MYKKILGVVFVLYTLFGFILLPLIVESQIEEIAAQETNAKLSIDDVYFNPFNFKMQLSGIVLETLEKERVASLDMLLIDLEPHSLFMAALHVKSVILQRPQIAISYYKNGLFNFSKIIKQRADEPIDEVDKEPLKLPRVIFDTLLVENGSVSYEDFNPSSKFELTLTPISFKLTEIDTKDIASSDASLRFNTALSDGGEIAFRGDVLSLNPLKLEGNLKLDAVKLYTNWKYIQDKTGLEVADGTIFLDANYYLNLDDLNATTIDNATLKIANLRVKPQEKNEDILRLLALNIDGVIVKPMLQDVYIKSVELEQLSAEIKRDKEGKIDWIGYLKPNAPATAEKVSQQETKTVQKSNDWSLKIDTVSLKKIAANLNDESVQPSVKTKLNELSIGLKNVTLAGEEKFFYDIELLLNDRFRCNSSGSVQHAVLNIETYTKCKDFEIVHYRPYIDQLASQNLKTYNVMLQEGVAGFDLNASLLSEENQTNVFVHNANAAVDKFVLQRRDSGSKIAEFKSFEIKNAALDTKEKKVTLERVALNSLGVYAQRGKRGDINLLGLIEPKDEPKSVAKSGSKTTKGKEEESYKVALKYFDLNSAKVIFDDKGIDKGAKTTLDKIELHAKNISSKEGSKFAYDMAIRVNGKGAVKSKGDIKHTPFEQKGSFELKKISLKDLTPYLQEAAYIKIDDGALSLNAKTAYKQKDTKHDAAVDGALKVENFLLNESRAGSKLVSFKTADVKSFSFKSDPNSLQIDELVLDSFYVDALINRDKSMNFSQLVKESQSKENTKKEEQTKKKEDESSFAFNLLKLRVTNSSAHFADYSLPIDFKTFIHDLNGEIHSISNVKGEVTDIDIDGVVDEYGSTKLQGSLDSSNVKSYLDIDFNFKNLDLSSVSGYSAQFAGYKIDKGKLFLDLKYNIVNSELQSKNSVVIRNIELGDAIEDENITKLPLGFAIALLEDKDGVIDINLPIEGNVDKPDFKYGALIVKTLANLIVKAVASPFKFLGSMMGIDAQNLKTLEFEAGESTLLPPQREKLDNLADILAKKPKLSLALASTFDKELDLRAIKAKKLDKKVFEISKEEHPTTKVLEKIYAQSGGDAGVLKESIKKSAKEGMFDVEYKKALYERCVVAQSVKKSELVDLANARADTVQTYLSVTKGVDAKSIHRKDIKEISGSKNETVSSELEIELK